MGSSYKRVQLKQRVKTRDRWVYAQKGLAVKNKTKQTNNIRFNCLEKLNRKTNMSIAIVILAKED